MSQPEEVVEPTVIPAEADKPSTITSLDDALKVIDKLRNENAAKRIKTKEIEDKAVKWEEYVASQKTELERLTESKAELERENETLKATYLRDKVAKEEGVPEDLLEFLTGTDEQTLRVNAKKLASVKPKGSETTAVDFYAGQRGAPVSKPADGLNEFFTQMWKESDERGSKTNF